VAQSSHFAAEPSMSWQLQPSPSLQVLPTDVEMTHASVDAKIDIDGALALIEEVKTMLAKMVAAEEAKKAAPTDVPPPFPPSDGQRLPPPYVPPPNRVVFKRKRCF
jgi:hypothetical protein